MHELGVTRRLLEVALERAADGGKRRVVALHVELGDASGVSAESIDFYWPEVSRATPAEGARLLFSAAADPLAFRLTAIDVDEDAAPLSEKVPV
jgi:Zn finger protein HypA/HybF involved in hydrogenase expression